MFSYNELKPKNETEELKIKRFFSAISELNLAMEALREDQIECELKLNEYQFYSGEINKTFISGRTKRVTRWQA